VESHLLTHLSKLRASATRFTVTRDAEKEGLVSGNDDERDRADRDPTGSRERRVVALKDLVAGRGYDVTAEDVAASIIRDAIVVAMPVRRH
jgi:hypothetical protein